MKINWGTGIIMAIVGFMSFILYLVITMTTNQEYSHELVTEEYYKQEVHFQAQLDKEVNAKKLLTNVQIVQKEEGLVINFPEELEISKIKGTILLYRPSSKKQDFSIPVSLTAHQMLITGKLLESGRWNVEIDWTYGEESYYIKREFKL